MNILRSILIALVAILLLGLAVGYVLPSTVHVQRSISVAAAPEVVFDILNSYQRFNEWSPWYELDPAARYTYSGPEAGVGARFEWTSDKEEVGSGTQEIVASDPPRRVGMHLDFGGQGSADAHFDIDPEGAGSRVTWALSTQFGNDILLRYAGLVMDTLIGKDFERGLGKLRQLAETDAKRPKPVAPAEPEVEEIGSLEMTSIEGITSLDPAAAAQSLNAAYAQLEAFMATHDLAREGALRAITRFYDESGWGYEAAIPFAATPEARARAAAAARNGIRVGSSYAGSAVKSVHLGSRANISETFQRLEDFAAARGLESNGRPWEQYVDDPRRTPEDQLRVEVFLPVKSAKADQAAHSSGSGGGPSGT